MTRAIEPRGSTGGGGNEIWGWILCAAAAVVTLAGVCLWLAAGLVALVSGQSWPSRGFSFFFVIDVFSKAGGIEQAWPTLNPAAITLVWAVLLGTPIALTCFVWLPKWWNRPKSDEAQRSMAKVADVKDMTLPQRQRQAQLLRPSLADKPSKELKPNDVGLPIGRLNSERGPLLLSGYEDVKLSVMAPRSGKSSTEAIPWILAAPGAVIATSNKSDLVTATRQLRVERTGERSWEFDPQGIAYFEQEWWFDPLPRITSVAEAERFARPFISTVEDERSRDIWGPAASELWANLVLAAAGGGLTLKESKQWLYNEGDPTPIELLRRSGFVDKANSLESLQTKAPETRSSVYFTAQAATKCLADPQILRWVTPGNAALEFDPREFVQTKQTLYMLSKEGGGSASPLVAALTDRILRTAMALADSQGVRLDPPFVPVLDEAANVCPIDDLPDLYSHLGSRGICPLVILQSPAQAKKVWGETGWDILWGASTIKVIGSGMDDADFAEDISKLIGDHDVTVKQRSGGRYPSTSLSVRQQRVLSAAQVRQLPKKQALLLSTGQKVAMVRLQPYYEGPDAAVIKKYNKEAIEQISQRAKSTPHPLLVDLRVPDSLDESAGKR